MKKAFTIVELAIVMVVIGIILSMAVKGKALVETARVKAEVAKFHKMEAAIAVYMAKTGVLPPHYPNSERSAIDQNLFISAGMITQADLDVDIPSNSTNKYAFFRCEDRIVGASPPRGGSNVCVASAYASNAPNYWVASSMNTRIVCELEMIMDDDNISTGRGLIHGYAVTNPPAQLAMFPVENYGNCSNFPISSGAISWSFRMF